MNGQFLGEERYILKYLINSVQGKKLSLTLAPKFEIVSKI